MSAQAASLLEQLVELRCAADDLADQVRDLRESFDFEPGELDEIEGRLDVIYRLRKKYGDSVEDMLSYLEKCRAELDQIRFADDTLARLEDVYAAFRINGTMQPGLWSPGYRRNCCSWICRRSVSWWIFQRRRETKAWISQGWIRCSS